MKGMRYPYRARYAVQFEIVHSQQCQNVYANLHIIVDTGCINSITC